VLLHHEDSKDNKPKHEDNLKKLAVQVT